MPTDLAAGAANATFDTPLVLLVEDHADSRDMYAAGLRHAGFSVQPAGTVAEAIATIPTRRVDVVVVDYSMPNMSGAHLAAFLKAQPATAEARYVLVTGHGADALRNAAATVHFDAMVKKPIASDQLARVLRRVLHPQPAPRGAPPVIDLKPQQSATPLES